MIIPSIQSVVPELVISAPLTGPILVTLSGNILPSTSDTSSRPQRFFTLDGATHRLKFDELDASQSSDEILLYQSISPEDLKFFAPLVAGNMTTETERGVILQKNLVFDKQYTTPEISEAFEKMEPILDKYGLWNDIGYDFYNWGLVHGEPVIYDFGSSTKFY